MSSGGCGHPQDGHPTSAPPAQLVSGPSWADFHWPQVLLRQSVIGFRLGGFLQTQEEVFARMKSSRVFVLPSTREGFGIAAIEANACGLPVITVSHPGNAASALIVEGENGHICQTVPESIAEKILEGLGNDDRDGLCESYARTYDWSSIACLAEAFYERASLSSG